MSHTPKSQVWLLSAALLSVLLAASCSEVRLNYGLGGRGLTSLGDRNLNINAPGSFEELTGTRLPSSSPTGNPPSGGNAGLGGGESGAADAAAESEAESNLPEPNTPDEVRGGSQSNSGSFRVRIAPADAVRLNGVSDSRFLTILIEDLRGNSLSPNDFELVWELADPSLAQVSNNQVISRVSQGETTLKISLKADPETWIEVPVIISNQPPATGAAVAVAVAVAGGGGGGGGGAPPIPPPDPTPVPIPTPDNVTGIVIFE